AAGELAAVGAEADAANGRLMPGQGAELPARAWVPELDRPVPAGRGQDVAVGMVRHLDGMVTVTPKRVQQAAAGRVPQAPGLVIAGGGDLLTVRAVADADGLVCVPAQGSLLAMAQPPEIMPFEAAQVEVCRLLGPELLKQVQRPSHLVLQPVSLNQVHLGHVE